MKNLQPRFTKYIIHMIARAMIALLVIGITGTSAYSQIVTPTPGATRCGAGSVTLHATASSGTIKWYTVPFYGTAIPTGVSSEGTVSGDGTTFTTKSMSVTKTYFVDAVDDNNCSKNPNSARIPVIATISAGSIQAAIFYTSNTFCKSVSGDQLVTRTGTAGGTYSAAAGLTLNSSTGAITPSTSSEGTYTVTYHITTPADGCTENDATTVVTITTAPITPVIRYDATPTTPISYCTTAGTITVIHTGASGGTYSASPTGLTINASTGTITTATSLSGTYTVTYFVPGLGGCDAMTAQATGITILQLPTAAISYASSAHSYFTKNQGTQSVSLTGTGVYTGGTYSSTSGLTIDGSTGAITPSSSDAGTYTVSYTLTAVSPCGTPAVATTTVTIYPLPTASIGSNQTVCQNSPAPDIIFTGAGGTAPYTFTYHINSGPDLSVTTTSGSSVTVSQPTAVTGTFTYTLSNVSDAHSSSQAQTETATITVSPVPAATFTYAGTPYCSSSVSNPTPTMLEGGAAGSFTVPAGDAANLIFISNTTGEIDIAHSIAGTYTVTNTIATAGGCGIITATADITITKLPVATFTYGSTTYCQNAGAENNPTVTFGAEGVAGTFTSVPAGVVFVSGTPGKIDLAASNPGTYSVYNIVVAAGGCADVTAHFELTIGAPPATPAIDYSGSPYCNSITEAQPVELTGTGGGAYTYTVTSGGPTLTISETTGAITPNTSSPGVYLVTYTVGGGSGCTPVPTTASVTINQTPAVTNESTLAICSGANTNITLTATMPSNYTWVLGTVSDLIINASVGSGPNINQSLSNLSYTTPGTVEYIVTPTSTANGCVGAPFTITVTVNPKPSLTITNPAAVCSPSTVDLTASAVTEGSTSGLTFTYFTDDAATTALSSPGAVTTTGTYYIKGTTASGCSSVREVSVTIDAQPTAAEAGANQNQCNSGSFTLAGNAASVGQGTWTVQSGTATIISLHSETSGITGVVAGTPAVLRWTIVNGTCSSYDEVTLTNDAQSVAEAGPNQSLCNTATFTMAAVPTVGTGAWSFVGEHGTAAITTASSAATIITTVPTDLNITLRWTETNGTCSSTDDVVIRNDAQPTAAEAGANQNQCNNGSFTLAGNAALVGQGTWTVESGTATITSLNLATSGVTGVPVGTSAVLRWTIVNGTCTTFDEVTLTNNDLPTITPEANAASVFSSSSIQTTPLTYSAVTNAPTTYSITWNGSPTNSFVAVTDQTLTASPIPISVPASTAAGTYTGTITVKNANGCVSTATDFMVTVYTGPVHNVTRNTDYSTIQGAIDAANAADVIQVASGTYNELVTVNKSITLQGVSSAATIIKNLSDLNGNEIIITVAADNVTLKDFAIEGFLTAAGVGTTGIYFNSTVSTILIKNVISRVHNCALFADALANVSHLTLTNTNLTNSAYGFFIYDNLRAVSGQVAKMSDLVITGGSISDNTMWGFGSYIIPGTTDNSDNLNNVTITGTTFSNNALKGLYFETLKNATFTNLTISNCGSTPATNGTTYYTHNAGIDFNLKGGTYSNIQILNSTINGCGLGDPNGGGILIKSRALGGYSTYPGTLDGVTLSNNTITNNGNGTYSVGVRIGESNNSFSGSEPGPTNVSIYHNILTGNSAHAIRNATTLTNNVDAINNYWGDATGPLNAANNTCGTGNTVSDNVTFSPWWTTSTGVDGSGTITAAPVITSPISVGATSVSGTCESGATVTVYVNGINPVTVIAAGTDWTATVSALAADQTVTAFATASGKCISAVSNTVTVP